MLCCICSRMEFGCGHNAWPVADGYCCSECNAEKVIPARMRLALGKEADG